jgi:pyridoxal phosphate enzyme (YggS family)
MTEVDRDAALRSALAALRERLARAAESAGRPVDDIELLPITKYFPASDVAILWRLGCRSFGESREQEASAKITALARLVPDAVPRWQMVGQVQRNKAKAIAAWADSVHSLSSLRAAAALQKAAEEGIADGVRTQPLGVYVQISLDGDTSRGGVDIDDPAGVDELCDYAASSNGLRLLGLMAVPPLGADPDEAFARLAIEHGRVQKSHPTATQLSAGMSGDLEIAVRHGSTCVRVGTAVMGQRPLTSP